MGAMVLVKGSSKIQGIGFVFVGTVKNGFLGSGMRATVNDSQVIVDRVERLETKTKQSKKQTQKQTSQHVFFTVKKAGRVIPSNLTGKTILFETTDNPYKRVREPPHPHGWGFLIHR
ncbi:MAG: hypothetical protein J7K00_04205 [Candidatus Diapherotrites archaeon]|nr:hypothetical protein [Candidatus Diapherotrites archaeon]